MSDNKKGGLKEFFSMNEVAGYFFRSKEKNRTDNVNLKMMHGINKISIVMFLLGIIYLVMKNIF
ncbi:DUF6728 family protein [Catalinimonas niigatensis]|uniref:DUF6728 family protein n=1 Tax=Catalinimonas niigatensis TaxID=1397264 RepID=UPI002665E79B|nr:DUF6728 family protein [Catalinimonas niigatensis]WPP50904.1 DUF6728 family protein [Catalinimonas niigatensis]